MLVVYLKSIRAGTLHSFLHLHHHHHHPYHRRYIHLAFPLSILILLVSFTLTLPHYLTQLEFSAPHHNEHIARQPGQQLGRAAFELNVQHKLLGCCPPGVSTVENTQCLSCAAPRSSSRGRPWSAPHAAPRRLIPCLCVLLTPPAPPTPSSVRLPSSPQCPATQKHRRGDSATASRSGYRIQAAPARPVSPSLSYSSLHPDTACLAVTSVVCSHPRHIPPP